jgi:fructose transport system substrate-binding protein
MSLQRLAAAAALIATATTASAADVPVIGLITKTDSNPFFVAMRDGAAAEAHARGAKLLTAAGMNVQDNASQVTAIENMVAAGAKTILITASDTKAIVPSLRKAREKGVLVIALDTAIDPPDAADALFATDNYQAGVLIGQYAKVALAGKKPVIATLDLVPGYSVGTPRHNGFLHGLGVEAPDAKSSELGRNAAVVCMVDSFGDQAKGQSAMENCLQKNPDINFVYTVNEPAAAGAFNALRKSGKEKGVTIVSIDGGCEGVRNVASGMIAATSQQYPTKMGALGVAAGVDYAHTGKKPSGYTDTGVALIAHKPLAGIQSKDVKDGTELCWGKK